MSARSAYCHLSCADNYKIDPSKKTHTATIMTWDWRRKGHEAKRKECRAIVKKHKCHVTRANPTHIFFLGTAAASEALPVNLEKALRKKSCCMPKWLLAKEKRLRKEAAIKTAKRRKSFHSEDFHMELPGGIEGDLWLSIETRKYDDKLSSFELTWRQKKPTYDFGEATVVFRRKWMEPEHFRLDALAKGSIPAEVITKMTDLIKEYRAKYDKRGFPLETSLSYVVTFELED